MNAKKTTMTLLAAALLLGGAWGGEEPTGSFKGSFKAYVVSKGKPKALTATVKGVLIDGIGHGTATIKGYDSIFLQIK